MKYATAMAFGGEPVQVAECDYQDYKKLGLLCPECKDPVFLRAEGVRSQNGKEVRVGAHFCHFPGKVSSLVAMCEQRVNRMTDAEIQKSITKAKGQRLRLLQRWFWNIFEAHSFLIDDANQFGGQWNEVIENDPEFDLYFNEEGVISSQKEEALKAFAEFEKFFSNQVNDQSFMESVKKYCQNMEEDHWLRRSGILSKLQVEISIESAKYLCSKSSRDILLQIFLVENYCNLHAGRENDWPDAGDFDAERTFGRTIFELLTIPWADEFAKLQETDESKAA